MANIAQLMDKNNAPKAAIASMVREASLGDQGRANAIDKVFAAAAAPGMEKITSADKRGAERISVLTKQLEYLTSLDSGALSAAAKIAFKTETSMDAVPFSAMNVKQSVTIPALQAALGQAEKKLEAAAVKPEVKAPAAEAPVVTPREVAPAVMWQHPPWLAWPEQPRKKLPPKLRRPKHSKFRGKRRWPYRHLQLPVL